MQVWGTCLGHQLLQILTANTSYNELLVETDSVVSWVADLLLTEQNHSTCTGCLLLISLHQGFSVTLNPKYSCPSMF